MIYKLNVKDRVITHPHGDDIIQNGIESDSVQVTFDAEWKGLTSFRAVFVNGDYSIGLLFSMSNTVTIQVPWEVLQRPGRLFVTFVGYSGETKRIVTHIMERPFCVAPSGKIDGDDERTPTLDEIQTLVNAANKLTKETEAAATRANDAASDAESAASSANEEAKKASSAAERATAAASAADKSSKDADAAENIRKSNETSRQTEESARVTKETARVDAEDGRVKAEAARATSEGGRVSAESARVTAEGVRKSAETARAKSETSRATNESGRVSAESTRATSEAGRAGAETARVSAESARSTAEGTRKSNETARQTAERARAAAETQRETAQAKNDADQALNNAAMSRLSPYICGPGEYDADTLVPTITGEANRTYYVPAEQGPNNRYAEWMLIEGAWELMGVSNIEISPVTTAQIDQVAADLAPTGEDVLNLTGLSYLWAKIKAAFAPKSHASTATAYGVSTASAYGHAKASQTTPLANGTVSLGSETASFARGDHRHPLQTTVTGSSGSCTGNAATATKLATARSIALAGDVTGTVGFDGSANVSISAVIAALAVKSGMIADSAITSAKILDGTITATDIANLTITASKIANGAIGTTQLADSSITSAKILDGTIATADLANAVITNAKLGNGSVSAAKLEAALLKRITDLEGAWDSVSQTEAVYIDGQYVARRAGWVFVDIYTTMELEPNTANRVLTLPEGYRPGCEVFAAATDAATPMVMSVAQSGALSINPFGTGKGAGIGVYGSACFPVA